VLLALVVAAGDVSEDVEELSLGAVSVLAALVVCVFFPA